MDEKDSPSKPTHSWLTDFLIDVHLSAPGRRWEGSSHGAPVPHAESDINIHSDSIARMDHA